MKTCDSCGDPCIDVKDLCVHCERYLKRTSGGIIGGRDEQQILYDAIMRARQRYAGKNFLSILKELERHAKRPLDAMDDGELGQMLDAMTQENATGHAL